MSLRDRVLQILESEARGGAIPEGFGDTYKSKNKKSQKAQPKKLSEWQNCVKKHGVKKAQLHYSKTDKKCYEKTKKEETKARRKKRSEILKQSFELTPEEIKSIENLNLPDEYVDVPLRERAMASFMPENMAKAEEQVFKLVSDATKKPKKQVPKRKNKKVDYTLRDRPSKEAEQFVSEAFGENEPPSYYENYIEKTQDEDFIDYDPEIRAEAEALFDSIIAQLGDNEEDVIEALGQGLMGGDFTGYSLLSKLSPFNLIKGMAGGCMECGCGGAMLGGAKGSWAKCVKKFGVRGAKTHYSKKTKRCYKKTEPERAEYKATKYSKAGKKLTPYMIFQKQMKGVKMTKAERANAYAEWKKKHGF